MRILKLFENFDLDDIIESKIDKVWKVDPYEFKDYIISSMDHGELYGGCDLQFTLVYPYPDSNNELCVFSILENGVWKRGPYFDNIDSILESDRYKIIIEVWVPDAGGDHSKIEKFYNYSNRILQEADIPYIASYPNSLNRYSGYILLTYEYTWGYKTKFINSEDF